MLQEYKLEALTQSQLSTIVCVYYTLICIRVGRCHRGALGPLRTGRPADHLVRVHACTLGQPTVRLTKALEGRTHKKERLGLTPLGCREGRRYHHNGIRILQSSRHESDFLL